MKFSFESLGVKLMAIHEGWLHDHLLTNPSSQEDKPLTLEEFQKKHEASLGIGFDYDAKTYFLKSHPNIALIPVIGETSKFGGWTSIGTQGLSILLSNAKQSEKYHAALIYIDSPGGAVDGMQDWSNEILNAGMPTLAFIDGYGASGGYWQAISTDKVIANSANQNIVGSIGVQTIHVDRSEVAKTTIGTVKIIRARQSSLKNSVNSYEPLTKEGEAWIVDRLSETADVFLDYVTSRRPAIKADSKALKGEVFTTDQAIAEGLIDGKSTYQEAIDTLVSMIPSKSKNKQNQSQTNNSQTMKFKSSWKALLASISFGAVANDDEAPAVTDERLEQLNSSLETANQTISDLQSQVSQLQGDLQTAQTATTDAEQDRDNWKAKAEKLAKGPGAAHVVPNAGKPEGGNEELSEEEKAAATIAALPHNAELDSNPLFN